MRKIISLSIMALICLTSLSAWDGERRGLQLGFGVGAGLDGFTGLQYDPIGPDKVNRSGIAFSMLPRVGYAFTNQLALYYSRHPMMYTVKKADDIDLKITTCVEALHMDYYLKDTAPSLFFGLGAGVGYFMERGTLNYSDDSLKGVGIFGTLGFEPIKHITTELSVHYRSQQLGANNLGVSLIVNVIGY
jgi:hypothetical protein